MVVRRAEISDTERIAATHKASIEAACSSSYNSQSISGWVGILSPAIYEDAIEHKIMILAVENEVDQLTLCSTINAFGFYQHLGYIGTNKTFHELPNGIKLECINSSA